jgi:hypothetical protein
MSSYHKENIFKTLTKNGFILEIYVSISNNEIVLFIILLANRLRVRFIFW